MNSSNGPLAILQQEVIACRQCPRLVEYIGEIGRVKRRAYREWDYWAKPVPSFGDRERARAHRGSRARRARLESHRPPVYGRRLGSNACIECSIAPDLPLEPKAVLATTVCA